MFFEVECLSRHECLWAVGGGYSSLRREEIKELHDIENNVDCEKLGKPCERKTVSSGATTLLDHADMTFYFGNVFVGASEVDEGATGHSLNESL